MEQLKKAIILRRACCLNSSFRSLNVRTWIQTQLNIVENRRLACPFTACWSMLDFKANERRFKQHTSFSSSAAVKRCQGVGWNPTKTSGKTGTFHKYTKLNYEVWYIKRSGMGTTSLIQIINVLNLSPKTFKTTPIQGNYSTMSWESQTWKRKVGWYMNQHEI